MKARKMQEAEIAESGVPMITPSVIACGDATFPKGTASAMAGNFAAAPKGVPLGELALRSKD